MKNIILLIIVGILFGACHDVTVGFLQIENASYGVDSVLVIKKELDEVEDALRIQNQAPWVTKSIQGVAGTNPIHYEIERVVGPTDEASVLFMNELTIIGGGVMYYPLEHQAPSGTYQISLRISNEGYSKVASNIFTFIVE